MSRCWVILFLRWIGARWGRQYALGDGVWLIWCGGARGCAEEGNILLRSGLLDFAQ